MKLIVGLGNPGRAYANNRHNIGFICLRHFARTHGIIFDKKQGQARIGMGEVAGSKVMLARPQTYMNLSGEPVSQLIKKFDINLDDLVVIHDDLDLPVGKIRIRQGGSSGGHQGINSITSELASQEFIRIRVGIGRPVIIEGNTQAKEAEVIAYVLSDFTREEKPVISGVMARVSEAVYYLLADGLTAAMNRYN